MVPACWGQLSITLPDASAHRLLLSTGSYTISKITTVRYALGPVRIKCVHHARVKVKNRVLHMSLLLCCLVLASVLQIGYSRIVGAAVIPHGDFAFDPSLVNGTGGSQALHDGAEAVGARIAALRPDIIFLTTPHGIALERDFAVYENSNASGFASIGQDLHNDSFPQYKVFAHRTVANASTDLAQSLQDAGQNVSGLLTFADSESIPLRWGEVVPLRFLRGASDASLMVWSMPKRRYKQDVPMVPELLRLGRELYDRFERMPQRVAVVISSDLAHTHRADGPYGFSSAAAPFDAAMRTWAASLDSHALLDRGASLGDRALSCGFTGLVLLHGLLERANSTANGSFTPHLVSYGAPTYYGMLVAEMTRNNPIVEHKSGRRLRGVLRERQR